MEVECHYCSKTNVIEPKLLENRVSYILKCGNCDQCSCAFIVLVGEISSEKVVIEASVQVAKGEQLYEVWYYGMDPKRHYKSLEAPGQYIYGTARYWMKELEKQSVNTGDYYLKPVE